MFSKHLRNAAHTRLYTIECTDSGWEVRKEQDSQVLNRMEYHDWHRVEHARRSITIEVDALRNAGWRVE